MKLSTSVFALIAILFITGCGTSSMTPDYARKANLHFASLEAGGRTYGAPGADQAMIDVWADKPAYVAWLSSSSRPKKQPRVVSTVVPAYPRHLLHNGIKGTVVVSIVINRSGAVEAARVWKSTEPRFNESAVKAVKKWKFLPAEEKDGPTMSMYLLPVIFGRPDENAGPRLTGLQDASPTPQAD